MKNVLLISLGVFLLFLSKLVLDIVLIAEILMNNNIFKLVNNIHWVIIVGVLMILLYDFLQRNLPYTYTILFVIVITLLQPLCFYFGINNNFPFSKYLTTTFHLVFSNVLILLFINNLKVRLQNNKEYNGDSIINYFKYTAIGIVGIFYVLRIHLGYNTLNLNFHYNIAILTAVLSGIILIASFANFNKINTPIDNPQHVNIENTPLKLLKQAFFRVLFLCSLLIGGVTALNFKVFALNLNSNFSLLTEFAQVLGFYTLGIGIIGIIFERILKHKLKLHFGIKASLRIFPIFLLVNVAIFLTIVFGTNIFSKDVLYICIVAIIFVTVLAHYSFDNILWNRYFSFYQPINIGIRHNFYIKSFGIPFITGILLFLFIDKSLIEYKPELKQYGTSVLLFITSTTLVFLMNTRLYKRYKQQLQLFLNNEILEENLKGSIFGKEYANNKLSSSQYLRYLNLLNIINPLLLRKVITSSIGSDDNFKQRVALIKADQLFLFELLNKLTTQTQSKYFKSSPNRDKISEVIKRFTEIEARIQEKHYVEQLSISKKVNERALGAILAYYSSHQIKKEVISRLFKDSNKQILRYAIVSSEGLNKEYIIERLIGFLNEPLLCNAAFFVIESIGDNAVKILERSFHKTGQSERVKLRIIQLYGLIASEHSVELLILKLNEVNQTFISASLTALSNCNFTLTGKRTVILRHEIEELCKILAWNMSISIDIQKENNESSLLKTIKAEINGNYNNLFNLLAILYDAKSIQLIRSNLFSNDHEKVAFALELANVLITDELKYIVIPLLQPTAYNETLLLLKDKIPTEKLSIEDICYLLIQRELKWVSPFTKACAMEELSKFSDSEKHKLFMANMVNPDVMLSELASYLLKEQDDQKFKHSYQQMKNDYLVLNEHKDLQNNKRNRLRYDMVNFLQTVPEFSDIPGEILSNIASSIEVVDVLNGETIEEFKNPQLQQFFYVLHSGCVSLMAGKRSIISFVSQSLISSIDLAMDYNIPLRIKANKDSVLYRINTLDLIDLFTVHHQIPVSIINNTNNKALFQSREFVKDQKIYATSNTQELLLETN